jgi:tetratricopeptide (TPR) repeat protein
MNLSINKLHLVCINLLRLLLTVAVIITISNTSQAFSIAAKATFVGKIKELKSMRENGRYPELLVRSSKLASYALKKFGGKSQEFASAEHQLGQALSDAGRWHQAEIHLTRAYNLRKDLLGPGHARTLECMTCLGNALLQNGRLETGELLLSELIQRSDETFGKSSVESTKAIKYLVRASIMKGEYSRATELLSDGFRRLENSGEIFPQKWVDLCFEMTRLLIHLQKYEDAEILIYSTLDIAQRLNGPAYPDIAQAWCELAFVHCKQNKFSHCRHEAHKALSAAMPELSSNHPLLGYANFLIGNTYFIEGKNKLAEHHLKCAISSITGKALPEAKYKRFSLGMLADISERRNQLEKALYGWMELLPQIEEAVTPTDPEMIHCLHRLASLNHRLGRPEEAVKYEKRLAEIEAQSVSTTPMDTLD